MNAILAAAHADFRQRVRSFRFVVVLMATLLACAYMLPPFDAGYVVMQLGNARGWFNSAWIGFVFGATGAAILPLLGFYLVKDSVQRDRDTRVGALLAASPISGLGYVVAKFLSNVAVFASVLGVATLMAPFLQWWRAEDLAINPLVVAAHAALIAGPSLLAVSALAVLFECLPLLRGALGNVVFFFLWGAVLSADIARPDSMREGASGPMFERTADMLGIAMPLADFEVRLDREVPDHKRTFAIGINVGQHVDHRIAWPGMLGDGAWIAARLAWSLMCLPFLLAAAFFFDRFDPARRVRRVAAEAEANGEAATVMSQWHRLTPLAERATRWRPLALVAAEWRLLLKRQRWWWYAGVAAAWIASATAPIEGAVALVVPIAWFWALTRWSHLGARAPMHDTVRLLASAPAPVLRQLPAQWLAATLMGPALVLPLVLRLLADGSVGVVAQMLVGSGFMAALALATGAASRGPRLFEMLFLILFYAAVQKVPGAAFGGSYGLAFAASAAPVYLGLAALLLAIAGVFRGRAAT